MDLKLTKYIDYLLFAALLIGGIYLANQIHFFNNDDWVHYKTIENFLNGNFSLHPYIGSTFYTQGFLAYFFAKIFGIANLPVLTITISILNIFIFYKLIERFFIRNNFLKYAGALLILLNPLYLYSSIGFMTENFVILFILLTLWFYFSYETSQRTYHLISANLFTILGFFIKQYTLFLSIPMLLISLFERKWKAFTLCLFFVLTVVGFYIFFFPKTEILDNQSVNLTNLLNVNETVTLMLNIFIYLTFFTIPLCLSFIFKRENNRILVLIFAIGFYFLISHFLKADEFPALTNVFTQKGLFPDLDGNKSQWSGYYKFFTYSFYLSEIILSLIFAKLILNAKRIFIANKFLIIAFISHLGLCLVVPTFYDRYMLPLLFLWILILIGKANITPPKLIIFISSLWLIIYGFFSYLYISDFIFRNLAVQNETQRLISDGVNSKEIIANRAWNNYIEGDQSNSKYIFSFDNEDTFDTYDADLEKEIDVSFPLNIFTSKKIYLYKIK